MTQDYPFKSADFVTSAAKLQQCPPMRTEEGEAMPEIAFVGRSNVGKSSLLNDLLRNRKLAKTSGTPGKTQLLNFFRIDQSLSLVDLPGYGFAKVPKRLRRDWGRLMGEYMDTRTQLKLILLLVDMRRLPNERDRQCLEWAAAHGKSVILVLTKADKLKKTERAAQCKAIVEAFGAENLAFVPYSTTKHIGRPELIQMINEALAEDMEMAS